MLIAGIGIANTLLSLLTRKTLRLQYKKQLEFFQEYKTIYYIQLSILLVFVSIFAYGLSFLHTNHDGFIGWSRIEYYAKFSVINFTKIFWLVC